MKVEDQFNIAIFGGRRYYEAVRVTFCPAKCSLKNIVKSVESEIRWKGGENVNL